ncbi:MAG: RNA polymerase sigma factor [Bacilli bacterium]|nr:RNA polymerase sigma factor [Bacilli bacterium]
MIDQINLKKFDKIYNSTYSSVQKYVLLKCSNIEDINDIIQDIYIDVYKNIGKIENVKNIEAYVLGIAKNKVNKYYGWIYRFKTLSIFNLTDQDREFIDNIPSEVDIEKIVLKNADIDFIWEFLKKKRTIISKIFFLYYHEGYTIKEISDYLDLNESYIKNSLYRTLKELQNICNKGEVNNEK